MSTPRISVVIPSYNHARFIGEAITSVLEQSLADLELIVIDDASGDDSWSIIQSIDDPRLRAQRHTNNQGAHATLNEGLKQARGEWLSILNSDDRYHPERLERLLDAAQDPAQPQLLATEVRLIGQQNQDWLAHYEKLLAIHSADGDLLTALCAGNLLIGTSNLFFSHALYQALGGFRAQRYVHDYDFALRAVLHAPTRLVREQLLDYRLHAGNTITEAPSAAINETLDLLREQAATIQTSASAARAIPQLADQMREQARWLEGVYRHRIYLKDQELRTKEQDLQTLNDELAQLRARLAASRAEAEAIRHSTSFRLGYRLLQPARGLIALGRRLRRPSGETIDSLDALRPLIEAAGGRLAAVSFDVFDTLLARRVEPPEAIQQAVARELEQRLHLGLGGAQLHALREQAEARLREAARIGGGDGECHFDELARDWASAIAQLSGTEATTIEAAIQTIEQEMEQRALYARPGARALLEWLRARGLAVIATSDMYLGERQLRALLDANGLLDLLDAVHVSSETGLCKHSGKLFEHLLSEHGWKAGQLLHLGDNAHSDHLAPIRAGVRGVWLREPAELRRRVRQRIAWEMRERGAIWPGNWFFDCLENSPPSADMPDEPGFFFDYGRWRLGPVFCAFLAGLVERLRNERPAQVFFVARDGYLFHQLYQQRPDHAQLPPSAYLYASRRAIAAAAIANGMREEQAAVALLNPKQQGLLSILKTFALNPDDFRDSARRHGFKELGAPLASAADPRLRAFLADPEVDARLRAAGQRARDHLEAYLEQIGFFGHPAVALVDIGWNGTIQRFLRDAFGTRKDFPRLLGYYFAYVGEIHDDNGPDHIEGLLYDARRDPKTWKVAGEFEELFEQGARSLEATTLGYREHNGRIEPLLKNDDSPDRRQELASNPKIAELHRGVLSLQPDFLTIQTLTGLGFDDLKPYARALIERMVIYPTREEVTQLTRLAHSEDFGHDHTLNLLDAPLRWRDLARPRHLIQRLAIAPWQSALFIHLPTPVWPFVFRWLKLRRQTRAKETP